MSTTETTTPEPSDDDPVDMTYDVERVPRTFAVGFTVEIDRWETTVSLNGKFIFRDEADPDIFDREIGAMRYLTYAERRDRALEKVSNGLYHLMQMPAVVEANSCV